MGNNKTLAILGGAFVVLLLVYLLMQNQAVPTAETSYLVTVDTSEVSEVSIYSDGQTVTLERSPAGWVLTNPVEFPANPRFVEQMMDKLDDMHIESLISEDEGRWSDFEVDTAGIQLTIRQGEDEATVIIGKAAEAYRQSYARRADEAATHLIRGSYATALKRPAEQWRDKRIVTVQPPEVDALVLDGERIVKDKDNRRFLHVEGNDSTLLDWDKVARVQSAVTRLQSSLFPEAEEYAGVDFSSPEGVLGIEAAEQRIELRFFQDPGSENRYFVRKQGDDTVFVVYQGVFNQIFKDLEELLPEEESN